MPLLDVVLEVKDMLEVIKKGVNSTVGFLY